MIIIFVCTICYYVLYYVFVIDNFRCYKVYYLFPIFMTAAPLFLSACPAIWVVDTSKLPIEQITNIIFKNHIKKLQYKIYKNDLASLSLCLF